MLRTELLEQAECARAVERGDAHPDDWQPSTKARNSWTKARQICGMCPVIAECFRFAQETGVRGVWGGQFFVGNYSVLRANRWKNPESASTH